MIKRIFTLIIMLTGLVNYVYGASSVILSAFVDTGHYGLYVQFEWLTETTVKATNLTDNWPTGENHVDILIHPSNGGSQSHTFEWNTPASATGQEKIFNIDPGATSVSVTMQYGGSALLDGVTTRSIYIAVRNTTDFATTYVVMQDGEPVGSITLQPGEAVIQHVEVPADSDVVVVAQVPGLSYDGDNWFVMEGAVYEQQVTPPLTPQIEPPLQPFVVPQPTIPENAKNPANNPSGGGGIPPWPIEEEGEVKNPNKDKPVWKHDDPNEDPDGQVDLLTNKIFREGIEKLLENGGAEGPEELEPGEAEEAPTVPAPDMVGKFALPTLPSSIGTVTTLAATIPGFNVSGVGWPSYDWTFDLDDHASAVSLVRGIFAGVLYICYFILCVRTIRGAAASEN